MPKERLNREQKAKQLFELGVRPVQIASHAWEVSGSNGRAYQIEELPDGTFNCTCPDALYRSHQGEMCKHAALLLLVRAFDRIIIDEYKAPVIDHDIHLKRERVVV